MRQKPESFPTRALHVVDQECWRLKISNYGEKKTSWDFYTRSEHYANVKKNIILKVSPKAVIEIEHGFISFVPTKRAE